MKELKNMFIQQNESSRETSGWRENRRNPSQGGIQVGRVIPVGHNGVELITSHTRELSMDEQIVTFATEMAILDGIVQRRTNRNPRRLRQSHHQRETCRSGDDNGEGVRQISVYFPPD
jgi:hypothetical protein